ncbi:MAG: tetratricopeptide repeat protein [Vulcanimicrobiota bacterium]
MHEIKGATNPEEVYRLTLATMLEAFSCERAFVAYGPRPDGLPTPRASHGILLESFFTSGELSLETVRKVMAVGKPLRVVDAMQEPTIKDRTSVILAGLRSILCVPINDAAGHTQGVLYLDHRGRSAVYQKNELENLAEIANAMGLRMDHLKAPTEVTAEQEQEWRKLRNRGVLEYNDQRFDEAEVWLVAARESARVFGTNSPELARSLNELGQLYLRLGRLAECGPLFNGALEILESKPGGEDLVVCLNNMAGLHFMESDFHKAEARLRQSLALARGESLAHRRVCVLYNLAKLHARRNQPDAAEDLLRQAVKLAEDCLGPGNPDTKRCKEHYHRFLDGQPL